MMLHTKYQVSRPCCFQTRRLFHGSPYISICKKRDPWGTNFGPGGIILTNLVEVYQVMLHSKYRGSRPHGFRQEDFFHVFPI